MSVFYDSLLTLIYPQACQICQKSVERQADGFVCADCWEETPIFNGNETLCHKCGAFLLDKPSHFETFCRRCDDDFYDSAKAAGTYEDALLTSILNLKHKPFVPKTLGDLLLQTFLDSDFQNSDLIIPVPLSLKRFAERGFNQAELLADNLARQINLTVDKTSLKRRIHTEKSRRGMDRKSRMESVKNAFEVVSPRLIEGKKVLLIDDVFTSGATVSNCAKALKKAGAETVYVLTAARAV
ncbi:MAG: ComF family protein [Pyrinomonadaceae bacterium]|nr:ComF family protein [Pyrinomonadaceae bacterium]